MVIEYDKRMGNCVRVVIKRGGGYSPISAQFRKCRLKTQKFACFFFKFPPNFKKSEAKKGNVGNLDPKYRSLQYFSKFPHKSKKCEPKFVKEHASYAADMILESLKGF